MLLSYLKMEDESVSLMNYVPSFARGFTLLLIHDDTKSCVYLSSLLELYSFKVTSANDISIAASMIYHHEDKFKLVIAKANMPGMDTFSFLDLVLPKDFPVIFIYSGVFDDVTQKALATGLCYFLKEPIRSNDLKYIWQHVFHSRAFSPRKSQNANFQYMVSYANGFQNTKMKQVLKGNGETSHNDNKGQLEENIIVDNHTMSSSSTTTHWQVQKSNGKGNNDNNVGIQKEKHIIDGNTKLDSQRSNQMVFYNSRHHNLFYEKKRLYVWTPELHLKFTEAIRVIGEKNARPKQILSWMNESYLTIRQVASHLQKHRLRLKRKENDHTCNLSPARMSLSLSDETDFPLPSKVSTSKTKGVPSPRLKDSLSENHNQNQYLLNNGGTEELGLSPVDQNHPITQYDDLIKKFVEDYDNFDLFENETNSNDVDKYCDMLRTIIEGSKSIP